MIVKNFPNLQKFKTYGNFINDSNTVHFSKLQKLESFCIMNEDTEYTGINLKNLNPLRKLILTPQYIEFDNLKEIVKKSTKSLEKI